MKKKMMALVLCVALVAVAAVGATMAYFTDTKDVTNTFTVGNVDITLTETAVDENGNAITGDGAGRFEYGNEYKLFPGSTYTKDPQVTVEAGSEDAYVRMLVEVKNLDKLKAAFPKERYPEYYAADDVFLLQNLVQGWDNAVWTTTGVCTEKTENIAGKDVKYGTYEFRYKEVVKAPKELEVLFTSFTIPEKATAADIAHLENVEIKVIANAIQAENLGSADTAWTAFGAQA